MAGYSVTPIADLSQKARGFFVQTVQGAIASVWANTFTVFAKVLGLLDFEHELRREWLFRQMFASTADEGWLTRHGYELGLTPDPALCAFGSATIAATPGTVVPIDLVFERGDGATFVTLSREIAIGDTVTLYLQAEDAGTAGNTPAGETLTLSADAGPIDGLGPEATVEADGLSGGTEAEEVESFRARILFRKSNPPHGGSALDYEAWTREVLPVVRDVFVDSFQNDIRSVWLQFTVTDEVDGIPTPAQVERVQEYLDDPVRRPVTARVFVSAPAASPLAIQVGTLVPDTPDVRTAIAAELAALFIDRARPGTPSASFKLSKSWIEEAICRATGEDSHDLVAPTANQLYASGQLPVLGAVTYTD